MTKTRCYSDQIDDLRRADASSATEISLRFVLIAATSLILWATTENLAMLVWGFGYIGMSGTYILFLASRRLSGSLRTYLTFLCLSILLSCWYVSAMIYLITLDSRVYEFFGICGIIGLGLYYLSRHSDLTLLAIWDNILMSLSILGAVLAYAGKSDSTAGMLIIAFAGLGISAYYSLNFFEMMRTRAKLRLTQEAEAEAQKMRAVGQLTSGIAHDFNNILTVIRGNLDLLTELPEADDRDVMVNEARNSVDRAAHLVRQLLAFSRKSQMMRSDLELGSFLKAFRASLQGLLPDSISIDVAMPPEDIRIRTDRHLLEAALLNCALNARDAMMPRGGTLRLRTEQSTTPGEIAILIEDSGPGLHEDIIDRVTEPFFTTKSVGEGSGLGLSMVKGFAEQSGGRLELNNLPQGGLQVALFLPLSAAGQSF
ncbi:Histidine kinase-, DNA gyrase B-, and HSP90-like ATPase [Roseovarius marisflavi]|uniref:histidine kinase n=1 Tax=Roseovarius marisflavi TaxID=1054996 RepID=A0A1M7AXD1_9RHOB|nr:ATP-binding protein [Roseovarius marisflavi]SHL47375.1 Histidine kinase-, DNA gyrase B-, and HSP90-like ATPase [Roseovarius marisflavi]